MAGRRRTRAEGEALEPTLRAGRPDRRREALAGRWATAQGAAERAIVAARFVQAARVRRQPDPELTALADREVDDLARQLVRIGDRLLQAQAAEPLKPKGHAA